MLLGDSVHAMMPNLGQGGCQAIEDAIVLKEELGKRGLERSGLKKVLVARRAEAVAVVRATAAEAEAAMRPAQPLRSR